MTIGYIHVSCKSTCDCILQWLDAPLYVTAFRPFLEEFDPASKIIASFYQLCVLQLSLILPSPGSANIPTMQASMVSWFSTREALAASRITTSLSTSFENISIMLLSTVSLLKVRVPILSPQRNIHSSHLFYCCHPLCGSTLLWQPGRAYGHCHWQHCWHGNWYSSYEKHRKIIDPIPVLASLNWVHHHHFYYYAKRNGVYTEVHNGSQHLLEVALVIGVVNKVSSLTKEGVHLMAEWMSDRG